MIFVTNIRYLKLQCDSIPFPIHWVSVFGLLSCKSLTDDSLQQLQSKPFCSTVESVYAVQRGQQICAVKCAKLHNWGREMDSEGNSDVDSFKGEDGFKYRKFN